MADPDLAALEADPELATIFLSETFDHLSSLEASVLTLEASPEDRKALNDVFRPFHTIKAGAGALGLASVEELAHRVENLLDRARFGEHRIRAAEIELMLASVDLLTGMMRDVEGRLAGHDGSDFHDRCAVLITALDHLSSLEASVLTLEASPEDRKST